MKTDKKQVAAMVASKKRNLLKAKLAERGESIQQWLERLIDREIKAN